MFLFFYQILLNLHLIEHYMVVKYLKNIYLEHLKQDFFPIFIVSCKKIKVIKMEILCRKYIFFYLNTSNYIYIKLNVRKFFLYFIKNIN